MKNTLIALLLLGFLLSCSNGEDANLELERATDSNLTGKWQLKEQLMDPGDGSGTFLPVESDHVIDFSDDGTFKSSKSFCQLNNDTDSGTTGTVDADKKVLVPEGCQRDESLPRFELSYDLQQSDLVVNLWCIEPCALKFKRVK